MFAVTLVTRCCRLAKQHSLFAATQTMCPVVCGGAHLCLCVCAAVFELSANSAFLFRHRADNCCHCLCPRPHRQTLSLFYKKLHIQRRSNSGTTAIPYVETITERPNYHANARYTQSEVNAIEWFHWFLTLNGHFRLLIMF